MAQTEGSVAQNIQSPVTTFGLDLNYDELEQRIQHMPTDRYENPPKTGNPSQAATVGFGQTSFFW